MLRSAIARRAATLLVPLATIACPGARDPAAPPCPLGAREDPSRAAAVLEDLSHEPESASLLEPALRLTLCFGDVAQAVLVGDHVAVLDARAAGPQATARLAHLAEHARAPISFTGEDCLEAALAAEARAWAIELTIQDRHGVVSDDIGVGFEALPPEERRARALAHLRAGPPSFAAHYRALCDRSPRP
ncbi:MAG: hypothetical protein R3A51_03680 [Nannocystaceae bacterium]